VKNKIVTRIICTVITIPPPPPPLYDYPDTVGSFS
jgi:hypothetical protein